MKKTTKLLALVLALVMALGLMLTGCGSTENPPPATAASPGAPSP